MNELHQGAGGRISYSGLATGDSDVAYRQRRRWGKKKEDENEEGR